MMSKCILALLVLGLLSCQSTSLRQPVPEAFDPWFASCKPLDGSGQLIIMTPELTEQLDVEWRQHTGFEFQAFTTFGQPVVRMHMRPQMKWQRYKLGQDLKVEVDRLGYIYIADNFIGLKSNELGCLLSLHWPRAWHKLLRADTEHQVKFSGEDMQRGFEVRLAKPKGRSCADVSWQVFWIFLSAKMQVCLDRQQQIVEVNLDDKVRFKWLAEP